MKCLFALALILSTSAAFATGDGTSYMCREVGTTQPRYARVQIFGGYLNFFDGFLNVSVHNYSYTNHNNLDLMGTLERIPMPQGKLFYSVHDAMSYSTWVPFTTAMVSYGAGDSVVDITLHGQSQQGAPLFMTFTPCQVEQN